MTKLLAYDLADGGVAIFTPAAFDVVKGVRAALDPLELINSEVERLQLPPDEWGVVDSSTISDDRTFRNAWVRNRDKVETALPGAIEVAHQYRRIAREGEFWAVDRGAEYAVLTPAGEAQREAIRTKHAGLQVEIDAATTEPELKAMLSLAGALRVPA